MALAASFISPAFLSAFRYTSRWLDTEDTAFIWNAPFALQSRDQNVFLHLSRRDLGR